MLRVEFHCHTNYSKDSLTRPQDLVRACQRKGIDRVVVTDHNSIAGALEAKAVDPERVIIGEEIMTTNGELLASFVKEEIPAGLSPREAIHLLHEQGAFISVSHPFDEYRNGHWQIEDLLAILPYIDAIEVFNARCLLAKFNTLASRFAQEHDLPGTVGSDAHAAFELGAANLLLADFSDADTLRSVIKQGKPLGKLSAGWVHLASRYAVWRKEIRKKEQHNLGR